MRLPYFHAGFTLEGLNLERFLRTVAQSGLPLLEARREGAKRMRCECYWADLPALRALCEEKGWRMENVRPLRLSAALAWLKTRWGVPVGLVLMLALSAALYQFVWHVEVIGAGSYRGDLLQFLEEERLLPGALKSGVRPSEIERKLYRRYPKLSWFSVYLHDVTLTVECTPGAPLPDMDDPQPGDVFASESGLVVSVETWAGTPLVKPGDVVAKGQRLISGVEQAADEQLTPVRAKGRVMARRWISRSCETPAVEILSTRTGRAAQQRRLCCPWYEQPAQLPAFLAWETEVKLQPIVGAFFPAWLRQETRHEVALEYAPRDLAAVKAEAAQAALRLLAKALQGDETVDKWVDYCMIKSDSLTATATAELLVNIAASSPP